MHKKIDQPLSYERPEVKTFSSSEVLKWIGPAQGMSSGYGSSPGTGPLDAYPANFGPGGIKDLKG